MSRSQDPIVLPSFLDTNSCVGLILMGFGGFELDFCASLLFIESAALIRGFACLMAAGVAVLRDTLRCSFAVHVCPSAVFIFDNLSLLVFLRHQLRTPKMFVLWFIAIAALIKNVCLSLLTIYVGGAVAIYDPTSFCYHCFGAF